ncbi:MULTISPECIES: fatty acyl-AMP ligase [Pseudofrankia]|uniref:fatty acyl-AMP ligase n=1 Tax=Pseudofrankia TaxID=2994363 RepID=UPI0002DAD517|nr:MULTISPECIES: fatty acyl-AMP ligase [Pseudofrankia]OHV32863.1 AMP-dependent synthetase [Pseudofrankia sp. EUN1h]
MTVDDVVPVPLPEQLAARARDEPDRVALTFVDYAVDRSGTATSLTYGQLFSRVCAFSARIAARQERGSRLAIVAPQGLDYVVAFLGALRAGIVAVPLFSPDLPGHSGRLDAVFSDCEPAGVATTSAALPAVRTFLERQGRAVGVIVVDDEPALDEAGDAGAGGLAAWINQAPPVALRRDDLAYLQYTSGSTRSPAGVRISHGNIAVNAAQAEAAYFDGRAGLTVVSWLPLFHDMGLVLVVGGCVGGGYPAVFMSPDAFLAKPVRWLRLLSSSPGAVTSAPNFAFDFCANRISAEDAAGLWLGDVAAMNNGAEPVQAATLDRFVRRFGPRGLRPEVIRPSYGLAEATVYVCGSSGPAAARVLEVDQEWLGAGQVMPAPEGGGSDAPPGGPHTLVSCGRPVGQLVAVVDPAAARVLPDGMVGEIWVHGPNVAHGYWRNPELSRTTFGQRLARELGGPTAAGPAAAGRGAGERADGRPVGPWLRTGDLGFLDDGELFVTGRLKDMIVIGGRNHYPQDVEAAVEDGHEALGRHRTAAFSVPGDDGERVVVVAEISRHALDGGWDSATVEQAVRGAVSDRHGLAVHDVVLTRPGSVPRTTSGKIARRASRQRYLAGGFSRVGSAS